MPIIDVTVHFDRGYIADPYWPELEQLITIEKESGVNRARSMERRKQALEQYLNARAMTPDDLEALRALAHRRWYTWHDVLLPHELDDHDLTEIVVPAHQLYGALANGADLATAAIRVTRRENVRTVLTVSNFATGLHEADAREWVRFARHELTNQRGLRRSWYIGPCSASGTLKFSEHVVDEPKVRTFVEFVGRDIGVGAARKMGWGRYQLTAWVPRRT